MQPEDSSWAGRRPISPSDGQASPIGRDVATVLNEASGMGMAICDSQSSESASTTCPEAALDEPGRKATALEFDPVLGVPLPVGSSAAEKQSACWAHFAAAKRDIDRVTPSSLPLLRHGDLARHLASLGPSGVRRLRRKQVERIRVLAADLRPQSDDLISKADPHIAGVLRAAGKGGVHVALLEQLLVEIGYSDASALAGDLLSGLPLVGDVRTAPETKEVLVRDFECSEDFLINSADRLAQKAVAQQSRPPVDDEEREARRAIFEQTVADQAAPERIGPFRSPCLTGRLAPPTCRFAVKQQTSEGKVKVRCIDDFAASLVNSRVRVTRRIRMGKISDVLACSSILSGLVLSFPPW